MKEYFKINNIDVGFDNHPTEGTLFVKGALDTEVLVRGGKLRINLLTPALEITDAMHNGFLSDFDNNNSHRVDYLRIVANPDLVVESGEYNTQVHCPYGKNQTGLDVYNFPEDVMFCGVVDVQKGYVHIKGELKSQYDENKPSLPIEVLKCFEPKPLLPARKSYTLKEALEVDPSEVYDLTIANGTFDEFPAEVLKFKNLEKIWVGRQTLLNFKTLPDAFYELQELHTIAIYGSEINQLSEKINQLKKLEELAISHSQLTTLPTTIGELANLAELNLEHNKLTSLPEEICQMTNLKTLNLEGNAFQSLPQCLSEINIVKVDRKHRKLFMDTAYKSKNPNEIDHSVFDLSNYPKEKECLEKAIQSTPELQAFKDIIVDYSSMATHLVLDKENQPVPLGVSKVGGSPDLPAHLEHPKSTDGKLYVFHAQINCAEIAPFQNYLPREGMLYFFVNDEEYAEQPVVLYAETNKELNRFAYTDETKFTDSHFDGNYRKAVAVSFRNAVSVPNFYGAYQHGAERFSKYADFFENPDNDEKIDLLSDYDLATELKQKLEQLLGADNSDINLRSHSLNNSAIFTQGKSPQQLAAEKLSGEPVEWLPLLNMESVDQFNFWDAGTLTYCIHKKDLAIKDFSNISANIESS